MTQEKLNHHEECLKEFGIRIKKEINSNIKFWKSQDLKEAKIRALAFELIINELNRTAKDTNVPLQDIGIEDYQVPNVK